MARSSVIKNNSRRLGQVFLFWLKKVDEKQEIYDFTGENLISDYNLGEIERIYFNSDWNTKNENSDDKKRRKYNQVKKLKNRNEK